jgi:hypothetical protein
MAMGVMADQMYTRHAQINDMFRTTIMMTCALQPLGVWLMEHRRDAHTLILCGAEVQPPPRALVKRRADCMKMGSSIDDMHCRTLACGAAYLQVVVHKESHRWFAKHVVI